MTQRAEPELVTSGPYRFVRHFCGMIEERNLTATFPTAYPEYESRTKMLIPFLL